MQNILQHQNDVIANLTAQRSNYPIHSSNPFANDIKRQFLKSPLKFYKEVNPRKPILSFDGSNYVEWETAIDRTLQHAFVLEKTFLNDEQDRFLGLDLLENKAVAALMRSRRHKIILVEKMLRFALDNLPASESWLARFCSIMSDVERAKLTIDEFGGLFLQALAKAPPGVDAKNFEYSVSQPLDDLTTTPMFGQVMTIIQSALSKVSKASSTARPWDPYHPTLRCPLM
ncbi:hypothetical protein VP01_3845g1 [Puccinia sorghi]|uniref:Uncharacterized protein n=1 Tax=Puccinia sorghi TaxID=27349 RepID=A0A0L6UT96_9BASI|nr:hypothetical protein VP01_3845g1 [Puccinia sorghi]